MKPDKGALGRAGERRAAWFYRFRGYRVLARNVAVRGGEIDLIVRRGRTVVFVEVKTRGADRLGEPFEAVDRDKQLRIMKCAETWRARSVLTDLDMRFDVISIVRTRWRLRIEHFPHAFEARAMDGTPWRMV